MPTTKRSKLPKRSISRALSTSLGALPNHLGPLIPPPYTRRRSSLSELSHQTPSATLKKRDNHNNLQVCLCSTNKRSELPLILTLHFLNSDNGSHLLVHDSSEPSFTLQDVEGNAHLADDKLDGADVVRDGNDGSFLSDDVVEAVFDELGVLLTTTESEDWQG